MELVKVMIIMFVFEHQGSSLLVEKFQMNNFISVPSNRLSPQMRHFVFESKDKWAPKEHPFKDI